MESPTGHRMESKMNYAIVIAKTGLVVDVNESALPPHSVEHAHAYGWRQILNDSAASVQRKNFATDDEFTTAVNDAVLARFAKIESGAVGRTGRTATPKRLEDFLSPEEIEMITKMREKAAKKAA